MATLAPSAAPGSKLATARMLGEATACAGTGRTLGLGPVAASELYEALDWLLVRQPDAEKKLARKHLKSGCLVLYDVSSSYVEGRCRDLARFSHNRDGKKGKPPNTPDTLLPSGIYPRNPSCSQGIAPYPR